MQTSVCAAVVLAAVFFWLPAAASPPAGAGALPQGLQRTGGWATGDDVADAHYVHGYRYELGVGQPRDHKKAFAQYCMAALRGHAAAAYSIGWMLLNGRGIEADSGEAAAWLQAAAAGGSKAALGALRLIPSVEPSKKTNCRSPQPRLAPRMEAQMAALRARAPCPVRTLVATLAPEYGVDPDLVLAVIAVESAFDSRAVSRADARGLMQLMPATAERFAVDDVFDPQQNVRGGVRYLAWLMARFEGDLDRVLAAYNAGEGAVERYGGIPPYDETRQYVRKVRRFYAPADEMEFARP